MRNRLSFFAAAILALIPAGCAKNLYDTDASLYRQYKYWDTAAKDWTSFNGFEFLVEESASRNEHRLFLTPHKQGLPNFQGAYIDSAKELSFQRMEQTCGAKNFDVVRAKAPENGRTLDRYFYQYPNLTVGVTFACRRPNEPKETVDDEKDNMYKWQKAARTIESVNGRDVIVYRLSSHDGLHQIKLRVIKDALTSLTGIARKIMLDTCGSPDFEVVYKKKDADYAYDQGIPHLLSRNNVYSYGFYCTLNFR